MITYAAIHATASHSYARTTFYLRVTETIGHLFSLLQFIDICNFAFVHSFRVNFAILIIYIYLKFQLPPVAIDLI
jgi:hypothetical protein